MTEKQFVMVCASENDLVQKLTLIHLRKMYKPWAKKYVAPVVFYVGYNENAVTRLRYQAAKIAKVLRTNCINFLSDFRVFRAYDFKVLTRDKIYELFWGTIFKIFDDNRVGEGSNLATVLLILEQDAFKEILEAQNSVFLWGLGGSGFPCFDKSELRSNLKEGCFLVAKYSYNKKAVSGESCWNLKQNYEGHPLISWVNVLPEEFNPAGYSSPVQKGRYKGMDTRKVLLDLKWKYLKTFLVPTESKSKEKKRKSIIRELKKLPLSY